MATRETIEIETELRVPKKNLNKKLRVGQRVPAVVYGPKVANTTISLKELDAVRYSSRKFENVLFKLKSSDKALNGLQVLRKDTSFHKVNRRPLHLDFYAIDMTKTVRLSIEIRFEGKPEGVKEGGVFNIIARDVEIECLPTDIPEFFQVDVSGLQLNDSLHVSDIKVSEKYKLITAETETICTVAQPKEEVLEPQVGTPLETAGVDGAPAPAAAAGAAAPAAGGDAKKADAKKAEPAKDKK
jgi:large subunit ribosomal protein L25